MSEHFRLGQYVRIGYRAWINQFGGPVGDKKAIDQLEADYRASLSPQHTPRGPRAVIVTPGHNGHAPVVRSKGRVSNREKRGNGRAE